MTGLGVRDFGGKQTEGAQIKHLKNERFRMGGKRADLGWKERFRSERFRRTPDRKRIIRQF